MKEPYVVRKLMEYISSDITHCVSKSCPKIKKCGRWWANNIVDPSWVGSMADFYKKGKKCEYEML